MLPDIDFRNIRHWRGSKNSGFEELCCQLYSLEPPEARSEFYRKEGAGGDAGVECLWTLPGGQVHGLQSKYFPDDLGPSQWGQIDHSVRTALAKYPSLSRYTVCLPRDLTDRRKEGETSQRDVWHARVHKWTEWAMVAGMTVEFVYWGSSELAERLTRDDARYSGRTLYWFGNRSLTSDWFERKFEMARANLGRRYTPEANVELPIRAVFDGLCRTPALTDELRLIAAQIRREEERLNFPLRELEAHTSFAFDPIPLREALARLNALLDAPLPPMSENIPAMAMAEEATSAREQLTSLQRYLSEWEPSGNGEPHQGGGRQVENVRFFAGRLDRELHAALALTGSRQVAAANSRALLIDGEAGMGKSHLLADIAGSHVERDWPAILLLGQHVSAGNPWDAFLSELDLKSYSVDEFLGALDAAGQATRVRALILIDAINEGGGRRVWQDHVRGFLASVQRFPHLAVVLTCRTTYLKSIFPEHSPVEPLTAITHHGFEGHESKAAAIYLDLYEIARPSAPLLSPEFSNPLFLRTCCEALNRQGRTAFPRGIRGIKSIFALYVDSLDLILADRMDVDPRDGVGQKGLRRLAEEMAANRSGILARNEAKRSLDEVHATTGFRDSLLHHLIAEGALAEDLEYSPEQGGETRDVVRFTFERFSDHFIAERLLDIHVDGDIDVALAPGAPLFAFIQERRNWHLQGVIEALAVQIPERYGRELTGLVQNHPLPFNLAAGFLKSVIWREPVACTQETADWLINIGGQNRGEHLWNTVLHVAAEPDHPFNADRLHHNLLKMELPLRDELWSIYLAQTYSDAEEGEPESITRTLIRWAWDSATSGADDETARLCGLALTWFFTTSNRMLRDHATKALVSLLAVRPALAPILLEAFEPVNDPYVAERLYGAVYGAVLQGVPDAALSRIALEVYRRVFEEGSPPPHVLLRDYARGTVEYALYRGCIPDEIVMERVRPPYASDEWPLKFPTEEEVESSDYDSIRSSVLSIGDFGRYVMGDSSEWSVTPLTEDRAETHGDRVKAFRTRIAGDPDPAVGEAFDHLSVIATPPVAEDWAARSLRELAERMRGDDRVAELRAGGDLEKHAQAIEDAEKDFVMLLPKREQAYFNSEIKPYLEWGPKSYLADSPVRFNIMDERRWVWRRAHSMGWAKERFDSFERMLQYHGRGPRRIERIGKKYQWIAWHELQARLSDHLYFIGSVPGETTGSVYSGPWQLAARDVDPSLLMHSSDRDSRLGFPDPVWWRPAAVPYPDLTTEERVDWLWSEDGYPDLKNFLRIQHPDGSEWLLLEGTATWREGEDDRDPRPRRDTWLRIDCFLVARADVSVVLNALRGQRLTDPFTLQNELEYRTFLGEHPWHAICAPELDDWRSGREGTRVGALPVRYLIPTVAYMCEAGRDQSIDDRIDLRLPSRFLREHLSLRWEGGRGVSYHGEDDVLRFFDPSTDQDGPPATLVERKSFLHMLDSLELTLMWRIGGEKGLYGRGFDGEFYGRQVLSGIFHTEGEDIAGIQWRSEERPPAT